MRRDPYEGKIMTNFHVFFSIFFLILIFGWFTTKCLKWCDDNLGNRFSLIKFSNSARQEGFHRQGRSFLDKFSRIISTCWIGLLSSFRLISVKAFLFILLIFLIVHVSSNGAYNSSNHAKQQDDKDLKIRPAWLWIVDVLSWFLKFRCTWNYLCAISSRCAIKFEEFHRIQ